MGNKLPSKFHIPKKKPKQGESPAEPSVQDAPKRQLPKVPEKPPTSNKQMVRALYNFGGISKDDLSFKKGDKLEVDMSKTTPNDDWWLATNPKTNESGYIPSNYVVNDDETPQSQDWWYDIPRPEAEKNLLLPGNKNGTFLIRPAGDQSSYVLSVLDMSNENEPAVKHYRVKTMDDGKFYISANRNFKDLFELIAHYKSKSATGLCSALSAPCPRDKPTLQFPDLEVSRDTIQLTIKLGAGCFGEVWKGRFRKVFDVAVKKMKPDTMSADAFLEEARIMHKLTHPRLVLLMAIVSQSQPIYIITELMVHGSLLDFLHSELGKKLKLMQLINMNCEIAEGMSYLESQQYIHRDLRAANVLVGERYNVKIADFGLARILEDQIYNAKEETRFPIKWTAPEAANFRQFTIKSDVWSFGILMYEIITLGKVPYPAMTGSEVLRMIGRGERMKLPTGGPISVPQSYYELMLKCWHQNAEDRPTFESLHDIFESYSVSTEDQYL